MNSKLSNKDKIDWKNFISSKDKILNKDLKLKQNQTENEIIRKIDLHGLSLDNANKIIEEFIIESFKKNINKIIVITGKGLRSKNEENPYLSQDLSILKNSVPYFIKSRPDLLKIIKEIKEADIKDGGEGAFCIFLKKKE